MTTHEQGDTIAAIATAPGEGGVSIIRISGPRSFALADEIFRCAAPLPSQRAAFTFAPGRVVEADGAVIDEALLLVMRAPHSYTREDVVELQGHGGPVVARRILRRALEAGARPAEPGEFTKRAFLNGRIDLLQAEAVLDLIRARSDRAASAAVEQLEGRLTARFAALYEGLLQVAGNLEATLDFPDEELPSSILDGVTRDLRVVRGQMADLLATWNEGHLLRDGATIVIAGKPNVGKSTLMNALLGKDRAIVSSIPGTTRDTIEEGLTLGGFSVKLVDTAGLRDSECEVELEGIRRTEVQLSRGDLYVYVLDSSQRVDEEDERRINLLGAAGTIVAANKADLVGQAGNVRAICSCTTVNTSAKTGSGLDELRLALVEKLAAGRSGSVPHAAISERHRALLDQAVAKVDEAIGLLDEVGHRDTDLAADALRDAMDAIGLVTGRVYHEDLLNSIFAKFCIGK